MTNRIVSIIHFNAPGSGMAKYAEYIGECYSQFNDEVSILGYNSGNNIYSELINILMLKRNSAIHWIQQMKHHRNRTIIHFTDTPLYFSFLLKYFCALKINCIVTIHDPIPHLENRILDKIKWFVMYILNKYIYYLSRSNSNIHIHLHSRNQKRHVKTNRIIFAEHPISNKTMDYSAITKYTPNSALHFAYIGRIEYYKGVDIFYDSAIAFSQLNPKGAKFTIAGRGRIKNPKKHDNISIINKYLTEQEFEEIICSAHIIVLPYRNATQSGVLSYSLARNKPVISTNVGLLGDYIKHGVTGYIIEEASVPELITAYSHFLHEYGEIEKMSIAASAYKVKYSPKTIGNCFKKYVDSKLEF
jgi:glycosyltransferase involved in cell wall biosynthesis